MGHTECEICAFSNLCPNKGKNCSILQADPVVIESVDDIRSLQKKILNDAILTLRKAEALARLGIVEYDVTDKMRKQIFDITQKMLTSLSPGEDFVPEGIEKMLGDIDE